jgi:hypothetical protein
VTARSNARFESFDILILPFIIGRLFTGPNAAHPGFRLVGKIVRKEPVH